MVKNITNKTELATMQEFNEKRHIQRLPIKQLHADPSNPRKKMEGIEEFVDSLEELPTIEIPVIVIRTGPSDYRIVDGERRFRAARERGLETIWSDIREVEPDSLDLRITRLRLNSQTKNWTNYDAVKEFGDAHNEWRNKQLITSNKSKRAEYELSVNRFSRLVGIDQANASLMKRVYDRADLMNKLKAGARWKEVVQLLGDTDEVNFEDTLKEVVDEQKKAIEALPSSQALGDDAVVWTSPKSEASVASWKQHEHAKPVISTKKAAAKEKQPAPKKSGKTTTTTTTKPTVPASSVAMDNIVHAIHEMVAWNVTIHMQLKYVKQLKHARLIAQDIVSQKKALEQMYAELVDSFPEIEENNVADLR